MVAIRKKRFEKWIGKDGFCYMTILLYYLIKVRNTMYCPPIAVLNYLAKHGFLLLEYLPYSPDLVLADFSVLNSSNLN